MNNYFDCNLIQEYFPEAIMIPAMKIWSLPKHKEHELQKHCNSGEYFAQEKKDGYFYQFNKTENYSYLFSRNESASNGLLTEKINNVPHIKEALECLPKDTIIIGEIYVPNGTSKDTTRIMGCLPAEAIKRQSTEGKIHFFMHDIIYYKGQSLLNTVAQDRYKILYNLFNELNLGRFEFLELAKVYYDNIFQTLGNILEQGGEGMVLKRKEAVYSPRQKPAWSAIKCKKVDYSDVVCIGFEEATKEYTGKEIDNWLYWENKETGDKVYGDYYGSTSSLVPVTKPYFYGWKTSIKIGGYTKDGELKEIGTVSSGLTDELKQDLSENPDKYLGKVVEVQCMEKNNKEYTFRHPILKRFRDDKNPKECTIKEIFR